MNKHFKWISILGTSILTVCSLSKVIAADTTNKYTILIDVNSTKADGKAWDAFGNAPDIVLEIEGTRYSSTHCKNTYRCKMSFTSPNKEWYLGIIDKDLGIDDLIGKGQCSVNSTCTLDRATVTIN